MALGNLPGWTKGEEKNLFMVTPCISDIKHFYCPTKAHNVKKNVVIKTLLK
jgi:hypothetical protein